MTIDKAIELLKIAVRGFLTGDNEDHYKALELGIEALKRCEVLAANNPLWAAKPLPGETER